MVYSYHARRTLRISERDATSTPMLVGAILNRKELIFMAAKKKAKKTKKVAKKSKKATKKKKQ